MIPYAHSPEERLEMRVRRAGKVLHNLAKLSAVLTLLRKALSQFFASDAEGAEKERLYPHLTS